jgi:hypothetical protein
MPENCLWCLFSGGLPVSREVLLLFRRAGNQKAMVEQYSIYPFGMGCFRSSSGRIRLPVLSKIL